MERLTRDQFNEKSAFWLLAVAMATLPFTRFLMLPIALFLMIFFLTDNLYVSHFKIIKEKKLLFPFFITLSIFVLSLLGTIYSDNVPKAISDWECKLWFLAAPIGLLPLYGRISLKQIHILLITFVISVSATAIGNFVISAVSFLQTGDTSQFFYQQASHFFGAKATHPSYLSMYCATAWLLSVFFRVNDRPVLSRGIRILLDASLIILPAEIILLQSKAGILLFVLLFPCALAYAVRKGAMPLWGGIAVVVGCIGLGAAIAASGVLPTDRLYEMGRQLEEENTVNPYNGTMQRVVVWQTSCEVAGENLPFGTGTGDVTDELCRRYEAKGYTYILGKRLNCHNQYLQHLVGLGIPGLMALLLFIGIPLWEAVRQKDFLQGMWWLLVAGNFLVESMLETRAGSNFIPLMTVLLLLYGRATRSAEAAPPNNP